jgi:dihydrodipicolinate synthase/N-acetylneuraminate lyase
VASQNITDNTGNAFDGVHSAVRTRYPQGNLAACMLPWTERFDLDVTAFQKHVKETIAQGYTELYVMGTAGEGYALSERQFNEAASLFAELTRGPELHPQIGVISLSMSQIIDRIGFCRSRGIRMFQISLPCWGALSDDEMLLFFKTVCGAYPDCAFLHYNLPRAKRIVTGSDYRRIIDVVPNLVATKNSTSDYARVADLMRAVPELQHFFLENGFAFGCLWGECSLLCSFDGLFPEATRRFYQAGVRRNWAELWRLHAQFNELEHLLFSHVQGDHIDGSFDKAFVWLKSPDFSPRLLPPYIGLSDAELRKVRENYETRCAHLS